MSSAALSKVNLLLLMRELPWAHSDAHASFCGRRLLETQILFPWHHYARETKRRNRGVRIAAHSRSKTQVAQWFRAWASTKTSYVVHRHRGGLMLDQKRRRQMRAVLAGWVRERVAGKVLRTRLIQTVKRYLSRLLLRVFSLWRSSCVSYKVPYFALAVAHMLRTRNTHR